MTTHPWRVSLAGRRRFPTEMPEGTVYVGRAYDGVKGHPLRNPHRAGAPCKARHHCKDPSCTACRPCDDAMPVHTRTEALDLYRAHLLAHPALIAIAADLLRAGLKMACHCPLEQACHIDVLTELATIPTVHPGG